MRHPIMSAVALLLSGVMLAGCTELAAGVAGGVAGSELEEDDGRFDPGENTELGEEIYD